MASVKSHNLYFRTLFIENYNNKNEQLQIQFEAQIRQQKKFEHAETMLFGNEHEQSL